MEKSIELTRGLIADLVIQVMKKEPFTKEMVHRYLYQRDVIFKQIKLMSSKSGEFNLCDFKELIVNHISDEDFEKILFITIEN